MAANPEEAIRLNKFVANAAACSRRQAAELIRSGKIQVNKKINKNPAFHIDPSDEVSLAGKKLKLQKAPIYILVNKPKGFICSTEPESKEKQVHNLLDGELREEVTCIDHLDKTTTGLLVLTNDNELIEKFANPKTKIKAVYRVTLEKPLTEEEMKRIKKGIEVEDKRVAFRWMEHHDDKKPEVITIELVMDRAIMIPVVFKAIGAKVIKLDRIFYAGFSRRHLKKGDFRVLDREEIRRLKHFHGA